jgi:glycosyltransferase involved in cell wall biosynthesis
VFDFRNPDTNSQKAERLRNELGFTRDDIFVLQPTRVVPRKWIERAVDLVNLLDKESPRLVISHESGDEGSMYPRRILEYANRLGVDVIYMGDRVGSSRNFRASCDKEYTIDDVYHAADLVTYPSDYEGFGNAFVEAVYFKKPIVVNRYSIYVEDIEPCGFEVIPFESFVTRGTVRRIEAFLEPQNLKASMEKNFTLGEKYFSYEVLEGLLLPLIESFN